MFYSNFIKNLNNTFIIQQDQADCGVVCLLNIIRFYGGNNTIENLRNICGTNSEGTTLLGLYHAAKKLNFVADGYEIDNINRLEDILLPAIFML